MMPLSDALSGFPSDGGDFRPYPSPMRNLEKERIREEIISAEIARRRELEAEVRQEIMFLEREMAIRRAARTGGFALGDSFAPMRCNARPPLPLLAHPFDDRLVPIRCSASPRPLLGHSSISEPIVLPLAPPPEDVTAELEASTEPNKDKLIVLVSVALVYIDLRFWFLLIAASLQLLQHFFISQSICSCLILLLKH